MDDFVKFYRGGFLRLKLVLEGLENSQKYERL